MLMLLSEEFKYRLINMCRIMPGKEKTVRKGKKIMQNNQITYEFASKIAYDVINKSTFDGIGEAYDMGDCYMFVADDPNIVYYTCRSLLVDKHTGDVKWYTFHDMMLNEDREKNKKELEVIDKYSYMHFSKK